MEDCQPVAGMIVSRADEIARLREKIWSATREEKGVCAVTALPKTSSRASDRLEVGELRARYAWLGANRPPFRAGSSEARHRA